MVELETLITELCYSFLQVKIWNPISKFAMVLLYFSSSSMKEADVLKEAIIRKLVSDSGDSCCWLLFSHPIFAQTILYILREFYTV